MRLTVVLDFGRLTSDHAELLGQGDAEREDETDLGSANATHTDYTHDADDEGQDGSERVLS